MHVPGWHEATRSLEAEGKIRVVGIIEEQHPDRARLFMQWKRIEWPVLVDSLDLLGVRSVPLTFLVDENGIIRAVQPRLSRLGEFLSARYPESPAPFPVEPGGGKKPGRNSGQTGAGRNLDALKEAASRGAPEAMEAFADALFLSGGDARLDEAIAAYTRALRKRPGDGAARFRLGVALRRRCDSDGRRPGDFEEAVRQWGLALEIEPGQYIWRRRIEQYGPRLKKPYPFYDWVARARKEIRARGDDPIPLAVEPGESESASPARRFATAAGDVGEPDPAGRCARDEKGLTQVECAVVPARISPGGSLRVHLLFQPNPSEPVRWDNEGEGLAVWVSIPRGWQASRRLIRLENPSEPSSGETRKVEFELKSPAGFRGTITIPAYALYSVRKDGASSGRRLRRDIPITVRAGD